MNRQSHHCFVLLLAYPGKEYVSFDPELDADQIEDQIEEQVPKNHTQAFFDLNVSERTLRFAKEESTPSWAKSVDLYGA